MLYHSISLAILWAFRFLKLLQTGNSLKYADYIHEHGVTQFLNSWEKQKSQRDDPSHWGDEIEYMVVSYHEEGLDARLSLRQTKILPKIQELVRQLREAEPKKADSIPKFQPECSRYILESAWIALQQLH
ncbi:unnamed protein product [Rhizoctonia solani]|uniref:Glutamate--cysteine ligase n=1 Tax=Rhizoctonia solani TaxID=456999 RepID=A0A8H3I0U3_9AGAM|nr:unnamed protein product [Rhizoctonia solani]